MRSFITTCVSTLLLFSVVGALEITPLQQELFSHLQMSEEYIQAFPIDHYEICSVKGRGSFYIDKPEDLIKGFLARGEPWEEMYEKLLKTYAKPGTIVLDIGAHIGTHTLTLSKAVGKEGRVIAFEPQRKIHRELCMNLRLNNRSNVIPLFTALGSRNTERIMSPVPEGNEGMRKIVEGYNGHTEGCETVFVRRLDDFAFKNVSFIKMDTEGYEDAVLEGARNTIKACHPVLFVEIQGGEAKTPEKKRVQAEKTKRTVEKLKSMGYTVSRIRWQDFLAIPKKRAKRK